MAIERFTPAQALAAVEGGAILIDIRPLEQRERDGLVPGAHVVARNVLEWRLDPRGAYRDPALARLDRLLILICDEGYQSSLAAAIVSAFGLRVGDVIGGVQEWRREGLSLLRGSGGHAPRRQHAGARSPVRTLTAKSVWKRESGGSH